MNLHDLIIAKMMCCGGGGGGGQTNVIESVAVNGTPLPVVDKQVDVPVPTKTSDLTNDSDFQTADEVTALIIEELSTFDKLDYEIVQTLPATGESGVRYLIKHPNDDRYEEYIYVNGQWYDIGATDEVNLDDYYTKSEVDALIPTKTSDLTNDGDGNSEFATIEYVDENGGAVNALTIANGYGNNDRIMVSNFYDAEPDDSKKIPLAFAVDGRIAPTHSSYVFDEDTGEQVEVTLVGLMSIPDVYNITVNGSDAPFTPAIDTNTRGGTFALTVPTAVSDLTNDGDGNSPFATEADLADKQDTLVSGTNIKTVNNTSLLGSGNIETAQLVNVPALNMGAVMQGDHSITFSNTTEGVAVSATADGGTTEYINKNLASVGYVDNELATKQNTLTEGTGIDISNDVISVDSTIATKDYADQAVSGKMDLVSNPTANNILVTDVNGQAVDSGVALSDKQDTLVSGTNIKTVGGETLLGSGNIDFPDSFMLLDVNQNLDVTIPVCTKEVDNVNIPNIDILVPTELQADWAMMSVTKYELFDANSKRINCWPVCSFTQSGQTMMRQRYMCGGTTDKVAKRFSGAILLKRR